MTGNYSSGNLSVAAYEDPYKELKYIRELLDIVNFSVITEIVAVFGTATNIVNVIVFLKMGFSEQINITLFSLTVSDLISLVFLHWQSLCYNPLFKALDLSFDPFDVFYVTGGYPHIMFTRITASLTAFITYERCLCIYLPLKVKAILTPARVKVVVFTLFALNVICVAPFYFGTQLGPKFFDSKNTTLVGLVFHENRALVQQFVVTTMFLIPFVTLVIVVSCTLIIVVKMRDNANWKAKSSTGQTSSSSREQRVSRMVVTLSTLFLVCFTPMTVVFIVVLAVPEFGVAGKYGDHLNITVSFVKVLEAINSSMNTFIYYNMSSKFRDTVLSLKVCKKVLNPHKKT